MRFIIKCKETEVSEDLKNYAQKRVEKLEKFFAGIDKNLIEASVEFCQAVGGQKRGDVFEAHVNLKIPGKFFRSEVSGDNLYALIDDAQKELEEEIRKFKTKKDTLFKRGARSIKKIYSVSPLARFRRK